MKERFRVSVLLDARTNSKRPFIAVHDGLIPIVFMLGTFVSPIGHQSLKVKITDLINNPI